MANYKPVIPRADSDFDTLQGNLMTEATANRLAWGIPESELSALQPHRERWEETYALAKNKNTCSRVQVREKNDAREIYEAMLRPFIQRWIKLNPMMSDGERASVEISPNVKSPLREPIPITVPLTETKLLSGNRVKFFFRQPPGVEESSRRGKPRGVKFCEIAYRIGSKPASADECTSKMITRSPNTLRFNMSQRGQRVYYLARWVNNRGEGGGWTQMKDFVIP